MGNVLEVFGTNRWCNSGHINVKEQLCVAGTLNRCSGCKALLSAGYVPPSALQQSKYSLPISGDHASLSATLPNFTQYVDCHTKESKTLDLLHGPESPTPAEEPEVVRWKQGSPHFNLQHYGGLSSVSYCGFYYVLASFFCDR